MPITIRPATAADVPALFSLVKELALYECAPDAVHNSEAQMLEEGFGAIPYFNAIVAEDKDTKEVIGMTLYHWAYSTWKGKYIYLDDFYVRENKRGQGIGKRLMDAFLLEAKTLGAHGAKWQVLDWNTSAIDFYKKYEVVFDAEWLNCWMSF